VFTKAWGPFSNGEKTLANGPPWKGGGVDAGLGGAAVGKLAKRIGLRTGTLMNAGGGLVDFWRNTDDGLGYGM